MNASPFSSFEEFSKATGAIYSFAHLPTVNMVLIGLVVLIGIAFLVKAYMIRH